jgi:hypothetical protein
VTPGKPCDRSPGSRKRPRNRENQPKQTSRSRERWPKLASGQRNQNYPKRVAEAEVLGEQERQMARRRELARSKILEKPQT